jgi:hypothetical protein
LKLHSIIIIVAIAIPYVVLRRNEEGYAAKIVIGSAIG